MEREPPGTAPRKPWRPSDARDAQPSNGPLDLTPEQEVWLRKGVGVARLAYHGALAEWKRPYHQGEKPHEARRRRERNALQGEKFPWDAGGS